MVTLNDDDLKVVSEAASLLPINMRAVFTRNVAARFDGNLDEAIRFVLSNHGVAVGRNTFRGRCDACSD
jgi:hypothetical protein